MSIQQALLLSEILKPRLLRIPQGLFLALLFTFISACSTQTVKTTTFTPLSTDLSPVPEDELMDIGIAIFDPGLEDLDSDEEALTFGDVRIAETFYVAHTLSQTLQNSGNWGVVRVIPHDLSSTDLAINGTILQSDGETMRLHISATDSSGRNWLDKEYEEVVSKFSYDPRLRRSEDSFQGLYNKVANDLLAFRQKNLSREELLNNRTISQIQFAKSFAPQLFDTYLEENRRGLIEIKRLPAQNDPILTRIESIRERDYLYVDTLQDYYSTFARQMEVPYTEFRRMSYEEVLKLQRLKADARRNMVLGALAVVGGIAATQSSSSVADIATYGGIIAGGWLIKDAFGKQAEAQMHVEALAELGQSLQTAITPQTIELEERTVTLSGSVEAQYSQWREILADIYAVEIGELEQNSNF